MTKAKATVKKVTSRKPAAVKKPAAKKVEAAPLSYEDRKALFLAALAKKHGEGAVVSRSDLKAMSESDERFPHFAAVRKDQDYRVGHGQYVVTTSANPTKVRDAAIKRLEKEAAQMLPKETRTSAVKLAQAVKSANTNKKTAKAKGKAKKAA